MNDVNNQQHGNDQGARREDDENIPRDNQRDQDLVQDNAVRLEHERLTRELNEELTRVRALREQLARNELARNADDLPHMPPLQRPRPDPNEPNQPYIPPHQRPRHDPIDPNPQ